MRKRAVVSAIDRRPATAYRQAKHRQARRGHDGRRPAVGVGLAASGGVQELGRNPDAAPMIQTNMMLGMAFAEAVAIYCLVVALLILFVVG